MQCVILAGGLGTGMWPRTGRCPKALLPVGGTPFAHHQLSWLSSRGVDEVLYLIGHLGDLIRQYVGTGERWGLRVRYLEDGPRLLGTGGALRSALEAGVLQEAFLLTRGDSYLPIDVREVWNAFKSRSDPVLMTVRQNPGPWDRSNVILQDDRIVRYRKELAGRPLEQMKHIDCGLLALRRQAIEEGLPAGVARDLASLLHQLSVENRLAGFAVQRRFYEIGSPSGLQDLERYFAVGEPDEPHTARRGRAS